MDLSKVKKVALLGRANSGKNTAALVIKFLQFHSSYSNQCVLMAFADPIKEMAMIMFPWADPECLYGSSSLRSNIIPNAFDRDGNPLTYRQLLIEIGEDGRKRNKDHWVEVFDRRLQSMPNDFKKATSFYDDYTFDASDPYVSYKLVIVTDLRFPNEHAYLRRKGFFIIKLLRDASPIINTESETIQDSIKDDQFDAIIENNGTLADLTDKIGKLVI